jgi:hypothetical protein
MSKHKHKELEPVVTAPPTEPERYAGYPGPGYAGFGGSAGYSGSGQGGISGGYAGAGYGNDRDGNWVVPPETRHDDRIHDDVLARLAMSEEVDASDIQVSVQAGEVTLQGNVETRHMKHIARDISESVPGVSTVHNRLHVEESWLDELKDKLGPEQHHSRPR